MLTRTSNLTTEETMPASRSTQLQKLYREHEDALAFADRVTRLAAEGTEQSLADGIGLIRDYYQSEMEAHLQQEEQTLFAPLLQYDRENLTLCMRLGKEHGRLRTIVANLRPETARQDLLAFGEVLREHTLAEEQLLLPLVESLFTTEQLDAVLNFTPLPWASVVRD
jgi:hemerythrin-like domain-containing protein